MKKNQIESDEMAGGVNESQENGAADPGAPKPKKKRKARPLMIVLNILIVAMIATGVWLLAEPYVTAWRQDQVMDQLFAQMENPSPSNGTNGTTTPVTDASVPEGTHSPVPSSEDYFEGIWVDANANHIPGEGWENFGGEEVVAETTAASGGDGYYVPNSVQLIPMGRMVINSIGLDLPLLKGAELVPLRYGAGWYESSARPGSQGRATILGHTMITGAARFFSRIPETSVGDTITIVEKNRTLHYQIYDKKNISVGELPDYLVNDSVSSEIMLVTCYNRPRWDRRYLVFARLVDVT